MRTATICNAIGEGVVCLLNPSDDILKAYKANGFKILIDIR